MRILSMFIHIISLLLFFLFNSYITIDAASSSYGYNSSHLCHHQQSLALLQFKQSLYSIYMENWKTETDCCRWDGVICNEITGDVIGVDLSWRGVEGIIHPDSTLFRLPHLQSLDLSLNDGLTGALPRFNSVPLELLVLSNCGFTGPIPKSLGNLRNLTILDLSYNMLNGSLPSELFTLQSLEEIDLRYNQLGGHIDAGLTSQSFKHLTDLRLSFNNFTGVWEVDTLFSSLINLTRLYLSYSGLSIFTTNATHYVNPYFTTLQLASCNLTEFPGFLRAMKHLENLDLSNNKICGPIPDWAGEIGGDGLSCLDLSHNSITAMGLPLFQWSGLNFLYLQSNLIQGPFPLSICNMIGLHTLDMSNNSFGGVLPQCFGNLTSFRWFINVGNNHFHGTIPNAWGDCHMLEGLILNGNQLDGELPRSLSKCISLEVLDLGNNRFNDTFPLWTAHLLELQVLILKSNKFHGPITSSSTTRFPYPKLRILDLSQNGFVDHLPNFFFAYFDAMKNVVDTSTKPGYMWTEAVPYSMTCVVKGVSTLFTKIFMAQTIIDLSENKFEGEIPDVIGILGSLKGLNLSHNSLTGGIPHALGNLSKIEWLDLSYNQLTGQIPQQLAQLTSLEVLNLSQNHLTGRIPHGPQFNTFQESFLGNPELCGPPLPNKCEPPPTTSKEEVDEDGESWFIWKVAVLGCGCGTPVGLVIGCLMFITKRPKWLAELIQGEEDRIRRRRKNKTRHVHIRR